MKCRNEDQRIPEETQEDQITTEGRIPSPADHFSRLLEETGVAPQIREREISFLEKTKKNGTETLVKNSVNRQGSIGFSHLW